jgi:hypothetical protein
VAVFLRLLFLAPVAFIVACFGAACVVVFALVRGMVPIPWPGDMIGMVLATTVGIGAIAALPTVVATLLAEYFALRSLFYWLAFGALLAALAVTTPWLEQAVHQMAFWIIVIAWMPDMRPAEGMTPASFATIAFAAAFVGTFVYWLIVGRLAGYSDVTSRA